MSKWSSDKSTIPTGPEPFLGLWKDGTVLVICRADRQIAGLRFVTFESPKRSRGYYMTDPDKWAPLPED